MSAPMLVRRHGTRWTLCLIACASLSLTGCAIRVCTVGGAEAGQLAFQSCVKDYDANKAYCQEVNPEHSTSLSVCLDAAKIAFEECAKSKGR